jgi:hypothetical protein
MVGAARGSRLSSKTNIEKEYRPPIKATPPPQRISNAPKPELEKQVEPGHCVMFLASLCIGVVFGLAIISSFQPWWHGSMQTGETLQETEVSLWVVKTRETLQSEEVEHFGCDSACDQTRVINNKVRTKDQTWDDTCRRATGVMKDTCIKLNIIRGGIIFSTVIAFCFLLPSCISFTGSENRSSLRFKPWIGLVLGVATAVGLGVALICAIMVQGRVPFAGDEGEDRHQHLNGQGFIMSVVAISFTVPSILMSVMSQVVASRFEKAPFGWDDDVRPSMKGWSSGFAEAPTVQKIAWPEGDEAT